LDIPRYSPYLPRVFIREMRSLHIWRLRPVILLVVVALFTACEEDSAGIRPTLGGVTESVYASLSVVPQGAYSVFASRGGIIQEIYVEVGDTVRKGQPLARIEATGQALVVDNARLNLERAARNNQLDAAALANLRAEMEQLRRQIAQDSVNYARQQRLWDQNIGSKLQVEQIALKLEGSRKQLTVLNQQYVQLGKDNQLAVEQAQNQLAQARESLGDFVITAKMDGKVYSLGKEVGELIGGQEALASIGKPDQFVLEMQIDEVDIPSVQVGQPILVSLEAYRGEAFRAEVTKIYPTKDPRTQTYPVEGKFIDPPGRLYSGLSGEANIVLRTKENVMMIPVEYLIGENRVLTDDGEVRVETGLRSLTQVEILSGIDTSTVLLKP
jgi:HlyD family secretion protein